jgi:hypothetical protein
MSKSNVIRNALLALALAGVAALLLFGILGVGRADGSGFSDVRYWRSGTSFWLQGGNPYDLAQLLPYATRLGYDGIANFAYPPTAFWMGLPLAGMTPLVAGWTWTLLNLAAVLGIVAGCTRLLVSLAGRPATVAEVALITAVMAGSPYTANVIWTGQTTLVISCALIWSWLFAYSGRSVLAGLLLAMASAKPQLAVFPALWLLLDRQWKTLFSAAVCGAALSVVPFMATGFDTIKLWLQATAAYMNEPTVVMLLSHNLNLASVAQAFHWPLSEQIGPVFMLAGAGVTALLYWRLRQHANAHAIAIGLLMPLSLLCLYGRDYDLAACGPLLAVGLIVSRRSAMHWVIAALLVVGLNVPHRVAEKIDPVYLVYWRPVLLLASILWVAAWACSREKSPEPTFVAR